MRRDQQPLPATSASINNNKRSNFEGGIKKSPSRRGEVENEESSRYDKKRSSTRVKEQPIYETINDEKPKQQHHHHRHYRNHNDTNGKLDSHSRSREKNHQKSTNNDVINCRPQSAPSIKVEKCPDDRLENNNNNNSNNNNNEKYIVKPERKIEKNSST